MHRVTLVTVAGLNLSAARAQAVVTYFKSLGVKALYTAVGAGKSSINSSMGNQAVISLNYSK